MRTWIRALGPSRPELVVLATLCAGAFVLLLALTLRLAAYGLPDACFGVGSSEDLACRGRTLDVRGYLDLASSMGGIAFIALGVLPVLVGIVGGLSLVAKDLEQGTTEFAWSITPSRRRWLASRVVPVALVIVIVGSVTGFLGDVLEGQRQPTIDPQGTFDDMGYRGPVIAAIALAALGISLLISAVVGRVLPAFLLAAFVVGASMLGVTLGHEAILASESVIVVANDDLGPGRRIEYLIRTPEGEILSFAEAYERFGTAAVDDMDPALGLTLLVRIVPGAVYPAAAWRLAVFYALIGLTTTTAAFAVIDRRRP